LYCNVLQCKQTIIRFCFCIFLKFLSWSTHFGYCSLQSLSGTFTVLQESHLGTHNSTHPLTYYRLSFYFLYLIILSTAVSFFLIFFISLQSLLIGVSWVLPPIQTISSKSQGQTSTPATHSHVHPKVIRIFMALKGFSTVKQLGWNWSDDALM
jgi:hypothetical protein